MEKDLVTMTLPDLRRCAAELAKLEQTGVRAG
jgi:hypothetical protein